LYYVVIVIVVISLQSILGSVGFFFYYFFCSLVLLLSVTASESERVCRVVWVGKFNNHNTTYYTTTTSNNNNNNKYNDDDWAARVGRYLQKESGYARSVTLCVPIHAQESKVNYSCYWSDSFRAIYARILLLLLLLLFARAKPYSPNRIYRTHVRVEYARGWKKKVANTRA